MDRIDLIKEVEEHLHSKRYKLALITSKKLLDSNPNDPEANALYAKSLLENLNPFLALDIINYAVEISFNSPEIRLNRAKILYRLSIYDGALIDVNFYLEKSDIKNPGALLLKSKILSGLERFFEALELLDELNDKIEKSEYLFFSELLKFSLGYPDYSISELIEEKKIYEYCRNANENKHFWFTNYVWKNFSNKIADRELKNDLRLLNFISIVSMFRIKEAIAEAEQIQLIFTNNYDYLTYRKKLNIISKFRQSDEHTSKIQKTISRTELIRKPENETEVLSARFFDLTDSISSGKRKYLLQFDENNLTYVAIELLLKNQFYKKENYSLTGTAIWYLNEKETGRNNFKLDLNKEWEIIEFVQSWGTEIPGFWKSGEGKVEILLNDKCICSRKFLIGDSEILNLEDPLEEIFFDKLIKTDTIQPQSIKLFTTHNTETPYSLENLLHELYEFVGLDNLKQSLVDFLTYLNFINERKKKGIKTDEKLELHCLFLGNPGTGKTSVARLLGKILKSMGVLDNGHVIEVDRSGLIGQYIGETAIKTDKIISQALGGILFIDEAYSLKKSETGSDFGQEAIDILLKRMEDQKGKFIVVAAGYPELMNNFIESNPGLKSRFTHTFYFDDYTPEQLIQIFKLFASREEYEIDSQSESFLFKQFENIYKNRDESFGNARLVRNIFNESKIQLSKRYQTTPEEFKENFSLNRFDLRDLKCAFQKYFDVPGNTQFQFSKAEKVLNDINNLIGLDDFKKEMNEIFKLSKYYYEEGESLTEKFNSHYFFVGNKSAGQGISAKYLSQLFYSLGIISKDSFFEMDVSQFSTGNESEIIETVNRIFERIKGGTFFLRNFDKILTESIISQKMVSSFLHNLSVQLQKISGSTIVIAEISPDFINKLPEEFSYVKSFFGKSVLFEDFTPDELTGLLLRMLRDKNLYLDEESINQFRKFFFNVYRKRNKYEPNLELIKNIIERLQKNHLLRIADLPKDLRSKDVSKTLMREDITEIIESEKARENAFDELESSLLKQHLHALDKLVGLNEVKQTIQKILNSEKVALLRKSRGLNVLPRNLHGYFIGQKGTGKTTVAKIYAGILNAMNLLDSGKLIELDGVSLKNLVDYNLETSDNELLNKLSGNLILIENVSHILLESDKDSKYLLNKILTLLQYNSNKFVLIVSDDIKGMEIFFDKYPEMKNYLTNKFNFSNFTPREMLEIALDFTREYGYELDEGAWQLLLDIIIDLYTKDESNGNVKTVLNLIHKAIINQEQRLGSMESVTDEDLVTITIEDISRLI